MNSTHGWPVNVLLCEFLASAQRLRLASSLSHFPPEEVQRLVVDCEVAGARVGDLSATGLRRENLVAACEAIEDVEILSSRLFVLGGRLRGAAVEVQSSARSLASAMRTAHVNGGR